MTPSTDLHKAPMALMEQIKRNLSQISLWILSESLLLNPAWSKVALSCCALGLKLWSSSPNTISGTKVK